MHIASINVIIIFADAIFVNCAYSPNIQYATRFRNLTIFSPTGSAYVVSSKMYGNHLENYFAGQVNVTRNFHVKSVTAQTNRCVYESYRCEHFLKFVVDKNIKDIAYAKNQVWSQIFNSIKPRVDLPIIKKGIYSSDRVVINATDMLSFYPDALKYYFQIKGTWLEFDGKNVVIFWGELEFHAFAKRKANTY